MTIREASNKLSLQLRNIYGDSESSAITKMAMENIIESGEKAWISNPESDLTADQISKWKEYSKQLSNHVPIQYVLHEAWFCDMKLYVDESVLIPRPETEELVEWVVSETKGMRGDIKIIDIGTGSGCIALALKKKLPGAAVSGYDISEMALEVARKNADSLDTDLPFQNLDFLDHNQWKGLPIFDIIVSNPPYVPESDRQTMAKNVADHEPSIALFVPNNDPLVFYRAMADFAKGHLSKEGMVFIEIHENLGNKVVELFHAYGFISTMKKDMQGKDRMIKVRK